MNIPPRQQLLSTSDSSLHSPSPPMSPLDSSLSSDSLKYVFKSSHLQLGEEIGKGSYGIVHSGTLRGKKVAVKRLFHSELSQTQREDFMREVEVMASLRHPNVLLFMGACMEPDNLLIVTELMKRGSVESLLRNPESFKKLTFKQKMEMAKQTAQGMNWLHLNDPVFIHRDLKTGNLLIDENWNVKISDFGLTHIKSHQEGFNGSYGSIGTPLWMAPEALLNKPYNEKVDLYGFGIILWELLTGKEPFPEIDSIKMMIQSVCIEHKRPPIPLETPILLENIITKCWHLDPNERPSFEQILQNNCFDHLIIDSILENDIGAQNFWKNSFSEEYLVSWEQFEKCFSSYFNLIQAQPFRWECLRAVLIDKTTNQVSIEKFSHILKWFGPLDDPSIFLDKIFNLLSQSYFHGSLDASTAEKILLNKQPTTFLVRLSPSSPGSYTISMVDLNQKTKHFRVSKIENGYVIGNTNVEKLQDIPNHYGKQLGLVFPCEGSPYKHIFIKKEEAVEEEGPKNGYDFPDFNL